MAPRNSPRIAQISLTKLLRLSEVRAAWGAFLPGTTAVVRQVNQSRSGGLRLPPSAWTERHQFGPLGTAFDYAVGSLWAGSSLDPVFARVHPAVAPWNDPLQVVAGSLETLLSEELPNVRSGRETAQQDDFFRGLGLLAHLDAMSRSLAVTPPAWALEASDDVATSRGLRRALRAHYPAEMVAELRALLSAACEDLPRDASIRYNPAFGCPPGLEHLGADGDLLVGETLWDLKASIQNFTRDHVWQLLGYAALDRLHGQRRIATLGLYNPRFRYAWTIGAATLVQRLGGGSLERFCEWFRDEPAAHGGAMIAVRSSLGLRSGRSSASTSGGRLVSRRSEIVPL